MEGGGLIRTVQEVHNLGLYWVLFVALFGFSIWVISPLAGRITPFMKHLSVAETMGSIYGRAPRVVTALSGIAASIATLTIQINVIALTISMCVDSVDPRVMTIIATLVLIAYSTFGGIRAVAYTDVFQFVTFTIVIPVLAWFMFQKIDKPMADIIPFLETQKKFQFKSVFSWNTSLVAMLALNLSCLVSAIEPPTMQRAYMASSSIQAKRVFFYAGILSFCINIILLLVGISVFIGAPELPKEDILGYIMGNIPTFLKGLVSISLLAMTMSTADSCLNSCAVMMSHDES